MLFDVPMRFETEQMLWTVNQIYTPSECAALVALIERSSPTLATNNPLGIRTASFETIPSWRTTYRSSITSSKSRRSMSVIGFSRSRGRCDCKSSSQILLGTGSVRCPTSGRALTLERAFCRRLDVGP